MAYVKTPMLFVWVNNRELADESVRRITDLNITYREKKASDGSFTIADYDFMFSDNKVFQQGDRLAFLFGWNNEAVPCGPFVVKSYSFTAASDGRPTLRVDFQDLSHKMNKKSKKRKHTGSPVDIIKKIAKEHELGYDIESIRELDFSDDYPLIQANMSDAKLLQTLADRYGFAWGLEGTTLYFRRPIDADEAGRQENVPVLSYRINGATLLNFSAEVSFIKHGKKKCSVQQKDVVDMVGDSLAETAADFVGADLVETIRDGASEALGTAKDMLGMKDKKQELCDNQDTKKSGGAEEGGADQTGDDTSAKTSSKEGTKYRATFAKLKGIWKVEEKGGGKKESDGANDEEITDTNTDGTPDSAAEAKRKSAGKILGSSEMIEATMVPAIASMMYKPGNSIIIAGVGDRYSGKYRMTEVTHEYGSSPAFQTTIKAVKREFRPSAADIKAMNEKQDKDKADKVPGNQDSGSGQPQKGERQQFGVFDKLSGYWSVLSKKVDGNDD